MTKEQGMGAVTLTVIIKEVKKSRILNIRWLQYRVWRFEDQSIFSTVLNRQLCETFSEANAPLSNLERKSSLYKEYWSAIIGKATEGIRNKGDSISVPQTNYIYHREGRRGWTT